MLSMDWMHLIRQALLAYLLNIYGVASSDEGHDLIYLLKRPSNSINIGVLVVFLNVVENHVIPVSSWTIAILLINQHLVSIRDYYI